MPTLRAARTPYLARSVVAVCSGVGLVACTSLSSLSAWPIVGRHTGISPEAKPSASAQAVVRAPTGLWRGVDTAGIDPSVDPCADMYQYASGKWLLSNPVPADHASWNAAWLLEDVKNETLKAIAQAAASDSAASQGSPARLVGDFVRSAMDERRINAAGIVPLQKEFDRVASVTDVASLRDAIAHLHTLGVPAAFQVSVRQDLDDSTRQIPWLLQGGLGLPERDYYFKDDQKTKTTRDEYTAHVKKMFELLGDSRAASEAVAMMEVETALARHSMTAEALRDVSVTKHPMTVVALSTLAPAFGWPRYLSAVGAASVARVNVAQPEFFAALDEMLRTTPIGSWRAYLRWQLVHAEASRLSSPFEAEDFHFYETVLNGTQQPRSRWARVLDASDRSLGDALGQLYVARVFPPASRARALALVNGIKAVFRTRIQELDWLSAATRTQALSKLDAMRLKVGYPDKWRNYEGLDTGDPVYVVNAMRADAFEFRQTMSKAGQPIDRDEWDITAQTIDAYYRRQFNDIVIPAAMLQPPYFDPLQDDPVNYGAIGNVIGHELTHGFDDQGRKYDAEGNLRDWWTNEDNRRFNARARLMVEQYSAYVPIDDLHVNGTLTLGENIADLGGATLAYQALERTLAGRVRPAAIEGFSPEQRFFLAFAQIWRGNTRPERVRLLLASDEHSPRAARVIGPLSNMPQFATAFRCPAGSAMVRPEANRVNIW